MGMGWCELRCESRHRDGGGSSETRGNSENSERMTQESAEPIQRSSRGGPHGSSELRACKELRARKELRSCREPRPAPTSCAEALESVIALAEALLREPLARAEDCSVPEHTGPDGSGGAQQRLALALHNLEPELALKVRTLMVAGRDGQSIHSVKIHLTLADGSSTFQAAANDTSENGPLLAEYLRRGHALAQASGLDLERPIAGWARAEASRAERDWQRFGRQLAQSHPDEWQCWLVAGVAPDRHGQLYLQHPEHGSWSFHAGLDRAEPAALAGLARSAEGEGIATRSLGALVPRLRKAQGVALRRAARAICARVGAATQP